VAGGKVSANLTIIRHHWLNGDLRARVLAAPEILPAGKAALPTIKDSPRSRISVRRGCDQGLPEADIVFMPMLLPHRHEYVGVAKPANFLVRLVVPSHAQKRQL